MENLFPALHETLMLVMKLGAVMFMSLFGIEILMQMGLMKYLRPIGKPVARLANLPSESALAFLSAIGSMIAAHMMTARFYQDGKLTDQELTATGVLNTVPFHFKETLTFQLPVVLPLLGVELCMIYIAAFWTAGLIKLAFVVIYGRMAVTPRPGGADAFDALDCLPDDPECLRPPFRQLVKDAWRLRKKMFFRMMLVLSVVTLIIQILINSGLLQVFEKLIQPVTDLFLLPPAVVGPISAYIFSPTVGITFMSNLMHDGLVSPLQAIVALLVGGFFMIPITRLRRTLPRYMSIFGLKNGAVICGLTTVLSMSSRLVMLLWVFIFYKG